VGDWKDVIERLDGGNPTAYEDSYVCARCFDDESLKAFIEGGVTYADGKIELARAVLAKHIIAAAKDGEFDQGRLRDGALLALRQSNLRSAPHSRR
jgi:hypothetical protein